jgi:hypothetical protein
MAPIVSSRFWPTWSTLESGVFDAEPLVEHLLKLAAHAVSVVTAWHEHARTRSSGSFFGSGSCQLT